MKKIFSSKKAIGFWLLAFGFFSTLQGGVGGGLAFAQQRFVSFEKSADAVCLTDMKGEIQVDSKDWKGVQIAVENLKQDLKAVCGRADVPIVIGSLDKSELVKKYLSKELLGKLQGKTEMYCVLVEEEFKGSSSGGQPIVIVGSDMRGTIYGVYELSRQIGVSPWYWWADVPVKKHDIISVKPGEYTEGEPAVRYRGIFLNDEAPCLTSWVKNYFGTERGGRAFYAKCFELLLRLKANFMWPAMWSWAFYADDPENSKTANEMGIIMGTSHHEPMARNHQEYARNRKEWGAWDYVTNKDNLDRFFREGMERAKDTEDLITIGMRGDGDTSMGGKEGHDDENENQDEKVMRILKDVIDNQRQIISDVTGRAAEERPQVWALYKEVQKYYDKGLRVPDDVTILLSDDNWGDIRSLPTVEEQKRKGGWGIYYHVDYVGAPRNSKWLNITPMANMWEQLQLTYSYGVDKIWILNVGDLKPMEYPISMFLDMAWDPSRYNAHNLVEKAEGWMAEQFGEAEAKEAARIYNLYSWYNGRVTPEMLDARTYDVESGEWKRVRDEYVALSDECLKQYARIQDEYRDAYYQLLGYPVQAMANLYDMYYCAATGDEEGIDRTFAHDKELSAYYNTTMAQGKWNGMMTQKHIGYRTWNDNFPEDTKPRTNGANKANEANEANRANRANRADGTIFLDAEEYAEAVCPVGGLEWTTIPYLGRNKSGVAVMPYTQDPEGCKIIYDLRLDNLLLDQISKSPNHKITKSQNHQITVYVITKSSLAFKNKGGHRFRIGFEGGEMKEVNINRDLNEDHAYDLLYPTVARRIIENKVVFDEGAGSKEQVAGGREQVAGSKEQVAGSRRLVIEPMDPGIVFERIVVDYGGDYRPNYLYE